MSKTMEYSAALLNISSSESFFSKFSNTYGTRDFFNRDKSRLKSSLFPLQDLIVIAKGRETKEEDDGSVPHFRDHR